MRRPLTLCGLFVGTLCMGKVPHDGSLSDVSQSVEAIPVAWAIITWRTDMFRGFPDENSCVGLAVSPTSALFQASCVQEIEMKYPQLKPSLAVLLPEHQPVQVGDVVEEASGNRAHWRVETEVSVAVHPKYMEDPFTFDFAVAQWGNSVPERTQPVALEDVTKIDGDVVITFMQNPTNTFSRSFANVVCENTNRATGSCIEIVWENETFCSSSANQLGLMVWRRSESLVVSGFASQIAPCKISSDGGDASATFAVLPTLIAVDFIDARTRNPYNVLPNDPPWIADDLSTQDENDATDNSSNITVTDNPDFTQPVAHWSSRLGDRLAFLSSNESLPAVLQDPTDGGLSFVIAPRFLLTRSSWIVDIASTRWAYFQSDRIAIRQLIYDDVFQDDPLVVIELEGELKNPVIVELPTTVPESYRMVDSLVTRSLNGGFFYSVDNWNAELFYDNANNVVEDASVCNQQPSDTRPGEIICVQSSARLAAFSDSHLPFNASFLVLDDFLLGVSTWPSLVSPDSRVAQPYQLLGASCRVRKFLDTATNGAIVWNEKQGLYAVSEERVATTVAQLYTNESTISKTQIPCGTVPIGDRYFLTMASCIDTYRPAWIAMTHEEYRELVFAQETESSSSTSGNRTTTRPFWLPTDAIPVRAVHLHPAFASSGSLAYDFAIIEVEASPRQVESVVLMPDDVHVQSRVIERVLPISGGHASGDYFSVVVTPEKCQRTHDELVCVMVRSSTSSCDNTTQDSKTHSIRALYFIDGTLEQFIGFSAEACDQPPRAYSQVSTIMNFVNAVAGSVSWGFQKPMLAVGLLPSDHKLPVGVLPKPVANKPYVVGLRMTKGGQNFCGGSLIAPQFVLTAAHCVTDGLANWVSIGSIESAGLNTEPIPVDQTRTRVHPQYKYPHKFSHDAAILELSVPAYASTIILDTTPDFPDTQPATMLGYGVTTATSSTLSPVMHQRDLTILSKATCLRTLPDIDDAVLCASASNGLDACTGDSGSPLVITDAFSGREVLVGVVSAGYGCGVAGIPGLYTRVASIVDFVQAYAVGGTIKVQWQDASEAPSPVPLSPTLKPFPLPSQTPSSVNSNATSLPFKERTGQHSGSASASATPEPQATTYTYDGAIVKTPLPSDGLTPVVTNKLFEFLLGNSTYASAPGSLLRSVASPSNSITFYSTGDVSGLFRVVEAFKDSRLNQRTDRFGTTAPWTSPRGPRNAMEASCTAPQMG